MNDEEVLFMLATRPRTNFWSLAVFLCKAVCKNFAG